MTSKLLNSVNEIDATKIVRMYSKYRQGTRINRFLELARKLDPEEAHSVSDRVGGVTQLESMELKRKSEWRASYPGRPWIK